MTDMSGIAVLLALCVAVACGWSVVLCARLRIPGDERAGYYGPGARRRRLDADADVATLHDLAERSSLDDLAGMVVVLDRLAWHGVPVTGARRGESDVVWTIEFADGTRLTVHTEDIAAMRRAAVLSHTDPLVVSHVRPDGARARLVLWAPRHGAVLLSVGP